MKRIAVVLAAVIFCVAADDTKKEMDKFKGKWKLASVLRGGKDIERLKDVEVMYTFDGDKWNLNFGGQDIEGTFKIDPTKKPKTIDSTYNDQTRLGIYEIEGDTLKICNNEPGEERPTEFKSKEETKITLATYKRVKEKEKDKDK